MIFDDRLDAGERLAQALRYNQLHRLPEQLFAPVAEEPFGLFIYQGDCPVAVDDDNGVRGRLDERPKPIARRFACGPFLQLILPSRKRKFVTAVRETTT